MSQDNTQFEQFRARLYEEIEVETAKTAAEMEKKARFKIQLFFQSERSDKKPVAFTLSVWESGKRLHGGGDECLFICRRQRGATAKPFDVMGKEVKSPMGCGGFISGDLVSDDGKMVCPHCMLAHTSSEVGDSVFFRLTADKAASVLEQWWHRLGCDADIYMKYSPRDIRVKMMQDAYGVRKARELKGMTIYPLENILKDTSSGTSVHSRFRALLLA
jgi:hypothetical protein